MRNLKVFNNSRQVFLSGSEYKEANKEYKDN